jgi:hypothetical protein
LAGDPSRVVLGNALVLHIKISTGYRGSMQENQGEAKNWPDGGMK